ncbi:MAG: flagellar basal body rod protein FlgC [Candidatus Neomarinimicrobiota bacterium]|nr:MAG: flagellar basal body rod protein FlgC [Candidatus Neomarinimicrobiota bacterium]
MKLDGILASMRTTFTGLSAQMKRLNVISENIANANKVAGPDEQVYARKQVMESNRDARTGLSFRDHMNLSLRRSHRNHIRHGEQARNVSVGQKGPAGFEVVEKPAEKKIYDPTNPKADAEGYIRLPDINVVEEMVEMISASRGFEANVNVLNAAKQMAKKAMEI